MDIFLKPVDKTAIIAGKERISYSDLHLHIGHYRSALDEGKVAKVAIFSENRPEWIYAFYAAWFNHSIAVPIDHLSSSDEIFFILNDCRPEALFCSESHLPTIKEAVAGLNYQIRILVFETLNTADSSKTLTGSIPEDLNKTALIIYTSGTTGTPKGVMLSFENVLANIRGVSVEIPIYQEAERVMIMLPLHHTFPLLGSMVAPLAVGATVAITPSLSSEDILSTLQENKITIIIGVPRFYNLIRKGIRDKIDKSSIARILFKLAGLLKSRTISRKLFAKVHNRFGGHLKYLVCGGAAIDIKVARDYQTLGLEMLEGYGMTEAAPMITFTRPGRRKLGSAGEALPGTEIRIKDEQILARGKNIMQGYYNRSDETAAIIQDGWLHTGDLGYIDKDGFLFITGRQKEIIVLSNGKNINPEEIEQSLTRLSPEIAEIGVYSKNDQIHCLIFPDFPKLHEKEVHHIEAHFREIIDRYNLRVSSYKKIMKMSLIRSELPKTRLGKIQRFLLESLAGQEAQKTRAKNEPNFPEYILVKDFLRKTCECQVNAEDHLEIDLGIDSLDKVNLITYLQNSFGITAGEAIFSEHSTVIALAEYCRQNKVRMSSEQVDWQAILKENIDLKLPKSWLSHHIIQYLLKFGFKLYFRLKGKGMENLPKTPCIITPNHQSFIDGFYITSLLKSGQLKQTLFFAKEKHLSKKWQKFLASRHNVIIMDINKDLKNSLQSMAAAIKKGKNIIIFPEGTRTKDGHLGRFKKFFAILSKELNVPVVPVIIQGAYDALPTGRHLPKFRHNIQISFSKPIFPQDHTVETLQASVYRIMEDGLANPS